jgi:hyperosmotically inducible periplasmic protein
MRNQDRISREVRHELVMLPYYSVFDDLAYSVNGDTVTLYGSVSNPTLKKDAENVVKKIEGVEHVDNRINALPPSPMDDQLRVATYRAIYSRAPLQKYGWGAVPSIHIIVNNGRVTLTGVVDNQSDKNLANIAANGVPGVFGVQNNLQVANQTAQ